MSSLVQSISDNLDDYTRDLPSEITATSIKSFIFGFAATYIQTSGNPYYALTGGVFTVVATVVDAAVMPLFKWTFIRPSDFLPLALRKIIVIAIVASCAGTIGGAVLGMEVVVRATSTIATNLFLELILRNYNSQDESSTYYFVNFHPWLV